MKRRQIIYAGVALAAVGVGGLGISRGLKRGAGEGESPAAGSAGEPGAQVAIAGTGVRPDELWQLTLPDVEGVPRQMSAWQGKRTVVNFWATWCAPCVKEMPDLQAMADAHPDKQIIGIGIDSTANIRAFLLKVPVSYPLLVAETGGVDLLRRLGNSKGGLPFTLVLDEEGRIVHQVLGQIDPKDVEKHLIG